MVPEVFICHAHENKKYAEELYGKLKADGLRPWLDKEKIPGGKEWEKCIEQKITSVDYFVVLLSKALNKREEGYVYREINQAVYRQNGLRPGICFILPVKIEKCHILNNLTSYQVVDLTEVNGFDKLIKAIKRDFENRKR
jgi:hypothetical protein